LEKEQEQKQKLEEDRVKQIEKSKPGQTIKKEGGKAVS